MGGNEVSTSGVKCSEVEWSRVKCSWLKIKWKWSVDKFSEVEWSGVKVLVTGCLPLSEDIYVIWSLLLIWLFRLSHSVIFFWFHFVLLYIWFCVLWASVQFCKLCILTVKYVPFCVFCFIVPFCVLFVCKCVLYCCHWVSTQSQLKDISYRIISICLNKMHFACAESDAACERIFQRR